MGLPSVLVGLYGRTSNQEIPRKHPNYTGECRGGGLIEIGRQVVRPRAAAAAAAAAEAASMPHKPNHKVHKIKQLMPQSKLAITLTFYLIFLKSSASAISIAQIATKRATPYMIPRIHQFWPHSYPPHQRRQSQRSSSEVGKSPLASTHIGDQLVLTPYDDKFPPPRRKNLSAVAPSRDPTANHTQRHYKSSIPNRPAVEQPIVYDDPGGGNQSHPTFATPLEGKMPYGDPRGVEQPKQQQGSSPTNNMRTLGKALVNTKLLAGRRLSIRQRRMRGKSTNYQVKDMQRSSSRRIPNNRSRLRGPGFRKNQSATAKAGKIYNSYNDFKISKYPKGSPQWQAEVIKYLLDMKAHGHRIKTVETNKDLGQIHKELSPLPFKQKMPHEHKALEKIEQPASESRQSASKHKSHTHHGNLKIPTKGGTRIVQGEGHATVVCKLEPYNVCFRINPDTGVGRPTGEVPVRLIRVY